MGVGVQVRSYKEHKSAIRLCVYNKRNRTYLSVDERFARLWKYTGQELAMITFPAGQKCFITDVVYVAEHNLFFATALDRTLKVSLALSRRGRAHSQSFHALPQQALRLALAKAVARLGGRAKAGRG